MLLAKWTIPMILCFLFLSSSHYVAHAQATVTASLVPLPGHLVPALHGHHPTVSLPPTTSLPLSIGLRIPNEGGLETLIKAQNDIRSPEFHRYLTPTQFTSIFSPTTAQVNAVTQYMAGNGIIVSSVSSNRLLLKATASVATIERAFHVNLAYFLLGTRTVFAPTNEPSVPSTIAPIILNIGGLDNVALIHPLNAY